ncbi:MAG TPA: tetratricopeptide repeat protein, partial [Vicinamibacterales bacterium]
MSLAIRTPIAVLTLCLAAQVASAQAPDPKRQFTEALGRFSAALDGRYGDDGARLTAGVAAMEDALARWDAAIRQVETSVTAEIAKSSATAAVRLRIALALTLAERGRVNDALTQVTAAITLSPTDVDAHTVLGLIHSQLTGDLTSAGRAFKTAVSADPAAPLQRYLLAKHLADQGAMEEAAAVGQQLRADARSPDAPDRAPFVRISLIPEVPGIEPFYPHARYAPAFTRLARGDYAAALVDLRTATAQDPLVATPPGTAEGLARAGAAFRDGDVA